MTIRFGIIGVKHGHLSGKISAIERGAAGDVEIAGAFEGNPQTRARRERDPAYTNIRWVPQAADLLDDDTIQGIILDGEIWQFLDDAKQSLLAGKHVYLEKPAGTSLEAYREVLDLAASRRLVVAMAYHFRSSPPFQLLYRVGREGLLGDIFNVRARIGKRKASYDAWLDSMPYPGHIMFEMCGHMIDPMVALLGRPRKVTPFLRSDYRRPESGPGPVILPARGIPDEDADRPFIDNSLAVLEWDRALGIVEAAAMEEGAVRRLEVLGTKGTLVIEPPGGTEARLYLEEATAEFQQGWQVIDGGSWTAFAQDLRDLAAAIRGEQMPPFGPVHDFVVQETLLRASGAL